MVVNRNAGAPRAAGRTTESPIRLERPPMSNDRYFVDEQLNRSDIRADPVTLVLSQGVPPSLQFNVQRVGNNACTTPTYEFASRFFFDETLTDTVHAQAPYSAKGRRNVVNRRQRWLRTCASEHRRAASNDERLRQHERMTRRLRWVPGASRRTEPPGHPVILSVVGRSGLVGLRTSKGSKIRNTARCSGYTVAEVNR
jgi:hypothetical protein